jgi:hypothetical protein
MTNLINLTPHAISVRDGGNYIDLASQGTARIEEIEMGGTELPYGTHPVAVCLTGLGLVIGLPEPAADTIYVVSMPVAQFVGSSRPDVVSPDTGSTAIRDEQGRIVAVRRFRQFHQSPQYEQDVLDVCAAVRGGMQDMHGWVLPCVGEPPEVRQAEAIWQRAMAARPRPMAVNAGEMLSEEDGRRAAARAERLR